LQPLSDVKRLWV